MATGIQANGVDLDSIFEPRASAKVADVNIDSNGGVDISNRFENITSGTGPATTNIKKNTNTDLNEIFAELGSTDPAVSLNPAGVTNSSSDNPVHAGIDYRTNGTEFSCTASGSYTVERGNWLDAGLNSEVWFERIVNTSTHGLAIDPGSGRLPMTSARLLEVQDPAIVGGARTANVTINMYDAATLGNLLDTKTFNLSANRIT